MRNHDSSVLNLGRCVSMSTWACVFFVRSSYFQVASAIHSVMNRSCGFLVNVVTTVVAQCLKLHQKVSFSILRAKRATFILFLSINRWFFSLFMHQNSVKGFEVISKKSSSIDGRKIQVTNSRYDANETFVVISKTSITPGFVFVSHVVPSIVVSIAVAGEIYCQSFNPALMHEQNSSPLMTF